MDTEGRVRTGALRISADVELGDPSSVQEQHARPNTRADYEKGNNHEDDETSIPGASGPPSVGPFPSNHPMVSLSAVGVA